MRSESHTGLTLSNEAPVIAYLFTTFPKPTETFLQREIIAMRAHGVNFRIYSLWGGQSSFRGMPVTRFNKWRLLTLFWMISYESWRRPEVLNQVLHGLCTRRAPSWINFWENMLGAGFACLFAGSFRKNPPSLVHAAWGGAPATAAWNTSGRSSTGSRRCVTTVRNTRAFGTCNRR